MSSNPHPESLSTSSQQPPAWLFSNNSNKSSTSVPSNDLASTMAKKSQKSAKPKASPASTSPSQTKVPPAQLMNLVESFLSDQGFDNAHREFQKHRAKKGWKDQGTGKSKSREHHSLVSVFQTWKTFASQGNTPVLVKEDPMEKITKVSSSSDSDSSDESSSESESDDEGPEDATMADAPTSEESSSSESSSSEDSDSDSESESDEEESKPITSTTSTAQATSNPRKRKAESDSESSSDSDSDEDMSDSSSDDGRPQTKKAKTSDSSDESSSSDSSDSESSEDEEEVKPKGAGKSQVNDEASSSESESESESNSSDPESDAEPEVDLKAAAAVPLPDSDSSSASESESDSDSDDEKPLQRNQEKIMNGAGSDTSATLDKTSPDTTYPPLPPDPSTLKANNRGKNGVKANKAQNQPFSRIRNDVAIDPRLSSNAYVSHGYGEKAHQDLIVTKGKGFTKEKNKKKRGSYKGGPLDIHQSRSIKFED
ncbi:SRP40, C-terminal domain-containing protein [Hypomontagnella monticulosa]|nr:SRP40, C-terminal domain-containing protein [Hypomontagnella monticulosa]